MSVNAEISSANTVGFANQTGIVKNKFYIFGSGFDSIGTGKKISAVPEPTSGLLLLLGVAGLALRRRRA